MQQNLINFSALNVSYLVGGEQELSQMLTAPILQPFDEKVVNFLNSLSKELLSNPKAKRFPDVVTLAFWVRKSSVMALKQKYSIEDGNFRSGRGIAFHIAPSNVAVNYAYSFITSLLCGNASIVRLPSKDFEQVNIINQAVNIVLEQYEGLKPYLVMVKYGHDKAVNDVFSSMADIRVIWGGDYTIDEIRQSPLKSRAIEITFADRYSLSVIDSDEYLKIEDKKKVARSFYNDTYLSDQNACTSPRAILWLGESIPRAKEIFWTNVYDTIKDSYTITGVQAINKLTNLSLLAVAKDNVKKEYGQDNLLVRVSVGKLDKDIMKWKDNSGYFIECDAKTTLDLFDICNDTRCQTISYIGDIKMFDCLLVSGVKGIDRIVPIGKTMDFGWMWDGHNLFERFTRVICLEKNF